MIRNNKVIFALLLFTLGYYAGILVTVYKQSDEHDAPGAASSSKMSKVIRSVIQNGSEDVARQATQPVDYPIILTDELHEKSDKMVVTIKEHLKRDLKFQKLMRERNEYKKSCLTKTPSKDTAVKIYFENQLSMWPDLHFHDDQTEKWWLQKCDVPCKWTTNRDEADVLVHFWFNDVGGRPTNIKPNQRTAAVFLEPWVGMDDKVGSDVPYNRLRNAIGDGSSRDFLDVMLSWASDSNADVAINYAYGSRIGTHPPLLNGLNDEDYDLELRRFLSDRFRLQRYPVFDKDLFFNSLKQEEIDGPMDWRGGDVAFFVSNCMDGIWRTGYLRTLVTILTGDAPYGYGLRVDSFGGCISGLGLKGDNGGTSSIQGGEVAYHGWKWNWNNPRKVKDMKVHFGDNYPRKKRPGDLKGGVSKNEMLDHYKVTLNFENSLIHKYITEKYFEGVASESVAIYFGSTPTEEHVKYDKFGRIASFRGDPASPYLPHASSNVIMGWDYPDPRDMALKIYQLCTDEKLWKSHFDWRIVPDEKELLPFRKEFVDLHKEDFVRKDKKNWMCRTCDHVARIDEKCWHQ